MSGIHLTQDEVEKFNTVFHQVVLAGVFKTLQSDEFIANHVKILADIDSGHEFNMTEVSQQLGLPEWAIGLFAEVRNADRRTATAQQNLMRDALGSANEFLEKCRSTKH